MRLKCEPVQFLLLTTFAKFTAPCLSWEIRMTVAQDDAVDPAIWDAEPLYADRFYVTTTDVVRFTFGEGISSGDETRYHTAIIMTRASAAELRDLLTKVLAEE
jgi:hypothetical protein